MFFSGVICDKCKKQYGVQDLLTKKRLTFLLRKDDWSIGAKTLCPECRPPKK